MQTAPGIVLSIVGVYLPTTDSPLDVYSEYLIELEKTVAMLQSQGPVLVLGDFSAHLGYICFGRQQPREYEPSRPASHGTVVSQ